LEQKFLYIVIGIIVSSLVLSFFVYYQILTEQIYPPEHYANLQFNKTAMWQIHDVIVDGRVMAFSNDDVKPYVILEVNKYYKNPQNAKYLTMWGDFGLNDEYCKMENTNCGNIVAYLYKNKNGIYSQGEVFGRITDSCDVKCVTGMR